MPFLILFVLICTCVSSSFAEPSSFAATKRVETQVIASNLEHPWGIAFLPGGRALVTERTGRLRLIRKGTLEEKPISGLPGNIFVSGQGGLLDVAIDPQFGVNGFIYLTYAGKGIGGAGTEVVRARLEKGALTNSKVIFRARPKTPGALHYGSRLLFLADNTLLVSIGERYTHAKHAQRLSDHLGTIVRINTDGSIPPDNPFISTPGAQPEVYSYGHRNMQGLTRDENTVWAHEHGPRGGDELNIIRAGSNYGWPKVTYGIDYSGAIISELTQAPGIEDPVVYWDPSIAPSGMAFYQSKRFAQWKGNLFIGALAHRHLRRIIIVNKQVVRQEVLLKDFGRIRDVEVGPDGFLYVLTDSSQGQVIRVTPVFD